MTDDHTYDGSNYADAECYTEDAHSLNFDGDWPGVLIAMAFAQTKATLAIADALNNRPETASAQWLKLLDRIERLEATKPCDCAKHDAYAAREAEWREAAEPDPLDESDHRDRLDAAGTRWTRAADGCWARGAHHVFGLISLPGPLIFAPEPPPDGAGDDLSASEGESGSMEGEEADDASGPLLCPECGHDVSAHKYDCWDCDAERAAGSREDICHLLPADIARALIAEAVKAERDRLMDLAITPATSWTLPRSSQ